MNLQLTFPIEKKFPLMSAISTHTGQLFDAVPEELSDFEQQIKDENSDLDLVTALSSVVSIYIANLIENIVAATIDISPNDWRDRYRALQSACPHMLRPSIITASLNPSQNIPMVIRPNQEGRAVSADMFGLDFRSSLEILQGQKKISLVGRVADRDPGSHIFLEEVTSIFIRVLQQFPYIRVEEAQ
jgi:hypothetical protein